MNIALIAHDEKKELMVQFCIAYCGVLSRNNLCATGTTGKMVSEATGLTIQKFLAGSQGGSQQRSEERRVDLGGRRIIKKKTHNSHTFLPHVTESTAERA